MGPYLIKMLHLQAQTILPTAPSACLVEGTRQDLFPVAQELGGCALGCVLGLSAPALSVLKVTFKNNHGAAAALPRPWVDAQPPSSTALGCSGRPRSPVRCHPHRTTRTVLMS